MAIGIGNSTVGGDENEVRLVTEAIKIHLIDEAKDVANTNLNALVETVDTMWKGVTADQFKEKVMSDKEKFCNVMDEIYNQVERDIYQMEANIANADSQIAANMGISGNGGGGGARRPSPTPTQPQGPTQPEQPTQPQGPTQPEQPQQPSTPPSEDDILKIISDEPTDEPGTQDGGSPEQPSTPQTPTEEPQQPQGPTEEEQKAAEEEATKKAAEEEAAKKAAEEEAARKAAEEEAAKKAAEEEAAKKAEEEQKAKEEEERKAKEEEERKAKEEEERKAKEEEERKAKEEEERKAKEEEERKAKEEEERKAKEEEERKAKEEEEKKKAEEEAAKKAAEEEAAKKAAEEEAAKKAAEEEAAKKAAEEEAAKKAEEEAAKNEQGVTVPYGDNPKIVKKTPEEAEAYNNEIYKSLNGHDFSAKSNGGTGHCGEQARVVLQKMGIMDSSLTEFSNGKGFAEKLNDSVLNGYTTVHHKTDASNQRAMFDNIVQSNGGSTGPLVISFDRGGHYGDENGHVVVITGISNGKVYAIDSSDANWNGGTTPVTYTVDQFKEHYFSPGNQAPGISNTSSNYIVEIK